MINSQVAKWLIILFSILLSGCFAHGYWRDGRNMMIGTKFDPLVSRNQQTRILYTKSYFHSQEGNFYYRKEDESPNARYYIQWSHRCRYSLLVGPDSTILSWRYEDVKDPGDCYLI